MYHQGQLRLLDPVNLRENQQVQLQIVADDEIPLKDLIGDMLAPFETDDQELDENALFQQLDQELAGKRPLSEGGFCTQPAFLIQPLHQVPARY